MKPLCWIIDAIYENPDQIVAMAKSMNYSPSNMGAYPGCNATQRIIEPFPKSVFEKIKGSAIEIKNNYAYGVFRTAQLNDTYKTCIHFDPSRWGGIIYLNRTAPVDNGTAFWRHKKTGLTQFPHDNWNKYGFISAHDAWNTLINIDGLDPEKWEQHQFVKGEFNRLLVLDSAHFHSHMPLQGFNADDSGHRLIQVFFFD